MTSCTTINDVSAEGGRPSSSSAACNSSATSVPSETCVETGQINLNAWLRSIVMSRSAFLLFHGFNPVQNNVVSMHSLLGEGSSSEPARERPNFTGNKDNDNLLFGCLRSSDSEVIITKKLCERIGALSGGKLLTPIAEAKFPSEIKNNSPRLDIAIGGTSDQKLLGFVEVGLTAKGIAEENEPEKLDHLFWKKVNQAIQYLQRLLSSKGVTGVDAENKQYTFSVDTTKTLVLCVLVINRKRTLGRVAVFACEPNENNNCWRMALMWRKEGTAEHISVAFGYYIESIKFMAKDDRDFNLDEKYEKWTYMGPNCSKVTVQDSSEQVRE
jgi:hypothetical protein